VASNDRAPNEVGFEASTSDASGSPAHLARRFLGPNPLGVLLPARSLANHLSEHQPLAGGDSGVPNSTGQTDARSWVGVAY
jgi:hypothetical protein